MDEGKDVMGDEERQREVKGRREKRCADYVYFYGYGRAAVRVEYNSPTTIGSDDLFIQHKCHPT